MQNTRLITKNILLQIPPKINNFFGSKYSLIQIANDKLVEARLKNLCCATFIFDRKKEADKMMEILKEYNPVLIKKIKHVSKSKDAFIRKNKVFQYFYSFYIVVRI